MLTILDKSIPADRIITIDTRKVIEGTIIDMVVSIPTTVGSDLPISISPSPDFPSVYKIKVNGAYVSNINSFGVTILQGQTSTVFTVETNDDGVMLDRSFTLNGRSSVAGYYVTPGNLTVIDKSKSPLITLNLRSNRAPICSEGILGLNNYITSIIPTRNPDDYKRYYRYQGGLMLPLDATTLVSQLGIYTLYAVNPVSGEVGTAQLNVVQGKVPTVAVVSTLTIYQQVPVDLTDSSVTVGSTDVDHFNYFMDALCTIPLLNPQAVTVAGVYYIQGVSADGCTAAKDIRIQDGGVLRVKLDASTSTLKEGESGKFTLRLIDQSAAPARLQKATQFVFTQDDMEGNTHTAGHSRIDGHTTFPFTVEVPAGTAIKEFSIDALDDKILYNDELLVLLGTNAAIGSASASVEIIDRTASDPSNLVITIGEGAIYYKGSVSISVSLPSGVTTAKPIEVNIVKGAGSSLSGVPAPIFPDKVTISTGGMVYFKVSGSNTKEDKIPAVLILEGTSTGYKVNPGKVTIYNDRIYAFMSVSDNGDGVNDFSDIRNIENYPDNTVYIIDRWGATVWEAKGYNNRDIAFTGKSNKGLDINLPEGTYYYVIRFYDETGELNIYKGSLQLKRGN